jgi:hypothetical protein
MRRAAGSSWRFAHGVEQLPHALLYVRDALRLPAEALPCVPPALSDVPPDRSRLLDPAARADAAREWIAWWATLVEHESRRRLASHGQGARAKHEFFLEYDRAVHPQTSTALAGTVLHSPALALFAEACDWAGRAGADVQIPQDLASRQQIFAWVVVRDSAEAVAAAYAVDAGAIDGAASVLLVDGDWWDLAAPRFALCSLAAATKPNVAGPVLRTVFESDITAA